MPAIFGSGATSPWLITYTDLALASAGPDASDRGVEPRGGSPGFKDKEVAGPIRLLEQLDADVVVVAVRRVAVALQRGNGHCPRRGLHLDGRHGVERRGRRRRLRERAQRDEHEAG